MVCDGVSTFFRCEAPPRNEMENHALFACEDEAPTDAGEGF
jgi:hypothetical protein